VERGEAGGLGGQVWQALALATSFGLTAALLVAGGVLGGQWLDGRLGTAPLFAVVGLFVGLAAGGYLFVRQVGRLLGGMGPK
jgi:ATP synthase protein I